MEEQHLKSARMQFDRNVSLKHENINFPYQIANKPYCFAYGPEKDFEEKDSNNSAHVIFEKEMFIDGNETFSSFMKRQCTKFEGIDILFKKYSFCQPSSISSERVFLPFPMFIPSQEISSLPLRLVK